MKFSQLYGRYFSGCVRFGSTQTSMRCTAPHSLCLFAVILLFSFSFCCIFRFLFSFSCLHIRFVSVNSFGHVQIRLDESFDRSVNRINRCEDVWKNRIRYLLCSAKLFGFGHLAIGKYAHVRQHANWWSGGRSVDGGSGEKPCCSGWFVITEMSNSTNNSVTLIWNAHTCTLSLFIHIQYNSVF